MRGSTFAYARLACICGLALAPKGVAQRPPAPIDLTLVPYAGTALRTLPVTIAGRTAQYIFDTGGGLTILDLRAAPDLGCTPFGRVAGYRADGQLVASQRCGPMTLTVGDYTVISEVSAFDLGSLLGKDAPPVGGLLALNSFAASAVTIDLAHDRLIVETPESLEKRVRGMTQLNVRIVTGAAGDVGIFLEVRARTGTLWMEVDSGNNGPVFLAPHALAQLGIDPLAARGSVAELDVIGLDRIPVRIAPREMIYDGQLNPAFLRQIVLTVDFAARKAWAVRSP